MTAMNKEAVKANKLFLLPTPKLIETLTGTLEMKKHSLKVSLNDFFVPCKNVITRELSEMGYDTVNFVTENETCDLRFVTTDKMTAEDCKALEELENKEQSYILLIEKSGITICSSTRQGALYGVVTLGQIVQNNGSSTLPCMKIIDSPDIKKRIISPTLTWYAGYARIGFGTQLWHGDQWKEFIDWCFRHKINVLNIVMYGFWPFEFPGYQETVMRDIKFKYWSKELSDWIELSYTHPNLIKPFLSDIIQYANERGVDIYAYVGLNSYCGGYAVMHPEKRMVLSEELKAKGHVNNYDSLCPSHEDVRQYLISAVKRIEEIGFNGIVFEESEETQWFCQCDKCREKYGPLAPNDAKHTVSAELLTIYDKILKPETVIGVRWLREPPVVKDINYLRGWAEKLPKRVVLFWAPGLEDDDQEFIKWVDVFGKDKIWSRNCEGSGFAACLGRIPYMIPDTFPQKLKESVIQHMWLDIAQFRGTANLNCMGINGYGFEWYGHESYFMATAQFGWNCWALDNYEFLSLSSRHMFGEENGAKYEQIIRTIPCIHETQICDSLPQFAMMPIKYIGTEGRRYLENCVDALQNVFTLLDNIIKTPGLNKMQMESVTALHIMAERMNETALAGIYYNRFLEEKNSGRNDVAVLSQLARKALKHAEADYSIIKEHYLDSCEHTWTGVPIGEYHIPVVINEYRKIFFGILKNDEFAPSSDVAYIYGGESLPWVWLLKWGPIIAKAIPKAGLKKGSIE